jgi:hypothetical protein
MISTFITVTLVGLFVYCCTRLLFGDRADAYPGGAVAAGLMTAMLMSSAWWFGMLAGLLAHLLGVISVDRYRHCQRRLSNREP